MRKIQDLHVLSTAALAAPRVLKDELPIDSAIAETVAEAREIIRGILNGTDERVLCVVGPC